MTMSSSHSLGIDSLTRAEVLGLARQTAEPAVTIFMPVAEPIAAHPEVELQLRALLERAVDDVDRFWGPDAAADVSRELANAEWRLDRPGEQVRGLVVLGTPQHAQLIPLPFAVTEQVVVNRTFATRQLFEGLARTPAYRALVLDGRRAKLFEGRGPHLTELTAHGFPFLAGPPPRWDTPQRDLPIHEASAEEEHRIVYRAVDDALAAATSNEELPLIVLAARRELAFFDEVTKHADLIVGKVHGNFARSTAAELAALLEPVVAEHLAAANAEVIERLREAHGRDHAVVGLDAVVRAATEGRGHLLVVEEHLTFPGSWLDGLAPGDAPDEQLDMDEVVDEAIERVVGSGGDVVFVDDGALAAEGGIGLLVRY